RIAMPITDSAVVAARARRDARGEESKPRGATGDLERVSRIRTKVEQKNLGGSPGSEARSAIGCRDGGIVGARASSGTTPGDLRRRALNSGGGIGFTVAFGDQEAKSRETPVR